MKDAYWYIGQAASLSCGVSVGVTYSAAAGFAIAYALFVLVDIRREVTK